MKKITIAFLAALISASALAQTDSTNRGTPGNTNSPDNSRSDEDYVGRPQQPGKSGMDSTGKSYQDNSGKSYQDNTGKPRKDNAGKSKLDAGFEGYRMMNGKMMYYRNGTLTTLDKDRTFSDGSVLRANGTLVRKNGATLTLQEDEYVNMNGKLMKSDKNKNMYLVPDSARHHYHK